MSRATGGDPAAFYEVDPRRTRLHSDVAAAAKNRPHLAVDSFDVHGAANGDRFTVNDTDGVCAGLIGTRGSEEHGAKHRTSNGRQRSAAQEANRVVESRHQRYSQALRQKVSPILYVGCSADA
jgi:hypothetical protein